jgi:hypothetical protein
MSVKRRDLVRYLEENGARQLTRRQRSCLQALVGEIDNLLGFCKILTLGRLTQR